MPRRNGSSYQGAAKRQHDHDEKEYFQSVECPIHLSTLGTEKMLADVLMSLVLLRTRAFLVLVPFSVLHYAPHAGEKVVITLVFIAESLVNCIAGLAGA